MGKRLIEVVNSIVGGHFPKAIDAGGTASTPITHGGTNVTTYKLGNGYYRTDITLASTTQTTANENLAVGLELLTFPKAIVHITKAFYNLSYAADGAIAYTVNPVIGLGTTMGEGKTDLLTGSAGIFEDVVTAAVITAFNANTVINTPIVRNGELDLKDGRITAKSLFLNLAAAWKSSRTLTYSGTISIWWYTL
jgi:hypothetical protein